MYEKKSKVRKLCIREGFILGIKGLVNWSLSQLNVWFCLVSHLCTDSQELAVHKPTQPFSAKGFKEDLFLAPYMNLKKDNARSFPGFSLFKHDGKPWEKACDLL